MMLVKILVAAVAVAFVSGCSVYMATQGSHKPDLSALDERAKRNRIETALGQPIKTQREEDGYRIDTYRYEIGNEPSAGRAAGHAALDVLTLGIWELAGTPIEASQGTEYEAIVTYDEQDRVVDFRTRELK